MSDLDLCWQVEAACAAAWPSQFIKTLNGFEFRLSPGATTKRNNSVNPTAGHSVLDQQILDAAKSFYTKHRRDLIVRVPDMLSSVDSTLQVAGFGEAHSRTKTLYTNDLSRFEWSDDVRISTKANEDWLEFANNRANWTEEGRKVFLNALLNIEYPILFAEIEVDEELAAIAYAVVTGEIAIIESVETAPKFRRQGRAAHLLSSLLAKCRSLGATQSALQVVAENKAARSLYKKLGFSTELYDYCYRTLKV